MSLHCVSVQTSNCYRARSTNEEIANDTLLVASLDMLDIVTPVLVELLADQR
jgi:hypothetical protein